jgi:hypothetical protein
MKPMNKKLLYIIPVLAAVVALVIVAAVPHVMADQEGKMWKMGKFKHHAVQVDGFIGSIPITKDTDRSTIKDKVTVSLSEASQGLDVHMAKLGKVENENGEKFLAWTLVSIDKDSESDTVTFTIHVVDAGDASNTAQVTKSLDHSFKKWHGEEKGAKDTSEST